jgi:hypothetical protein
MRAEKVAEEPGTRKPIRGTFGCCASTEEQSAQSMALLARQIAFLLDGLRIQNPKSKIQN